MVAAVKLARIARVRFAGILLIKHRAIKRRRTLVFTDTILAIPFHGIKREERKGHDGDATSPPTGLEAIIQLVEISVYVTAHKTNVITRMKHRR